MNASDDDGVFVSFAESGLSDLEALIRALPKRKREIYRGAQRGWDSVVRSDMMDSNHSVIEALKQFLVEMAVRYQDKTQTPESVEPLVSAQIAARYDWHRSLSELAGEGGREQDIIIGARVIDDVERMVEQMVEVLSSGRSGFNYRAWRDEWRGAA